MDPKFRLVNLLNAIFCVLFVCSVPNSIAADQARVFSPETYPDSLWEWNACGIDHPSLVCDPDGLLGPGPDGKPGIILLDAATEHIRANTECICEKEKPGGQIFGGAGPCRKDPPRGFTISVAVLNKMEVTDDQRRRYRAGAHLPAIFANELQKRLRRDQCADDVLIVLSVNDSAIRTSTGGVVATRLHAGFILNVSQTAQKYFSRGDNTEGLLYMVKEYGTRLGAPPLEESGTAWWLWLLLLLLLLLLALIIGLVAFFALRKRRQQRRRAGYAAGRPVNGEGKNDVEEK